VRSSPLRTLPSNASMAVCRPPQRGSFVTAGSNATLRGRGGTYRHAQFMYVMNSSPNDFRSKASLVALSFGNCGISLTIPNLKALTRLDSAAVAGNLIPPLCIMQSSPVFTKRSEVKIQCSYLLCAGLNHSFLNCLKNSLCLLTCSFKSSSVRSGSESKY